MDPDAALRMIDDADRVDAETREVMRGLHSWLSRGGFAPDWDSYPTGTRRYRKAYGKQQSRSSSAHSTKALAPGTTVVKLKDRDRGHIVLTVREGVVVGAMGSEPKRYVGMTLDRAKHVARYGGTGEKASTDRATKRSTTRARNHATVSSSSSSGSSGSSSGGIQVGDIVQRSDVNGKNRYVVTDVRPPWIYTRRISGSGTPGIITFPTPSMLRKVT